MHECFSGVSLTLLCGHDEIQGWYLTCIISSNLFNNLRVNSLTDEENKLAPGLTARKQSP